MTSLTFENINLALTVIAVILMVTFELSSNSHGRINLIIDRKKFVRSMSVVGFLLITTIVIRIIGLIFY